MNIIEVVCLCHNTHKRIKRKELGNAWLDAFGAYIKKYHPDGSFDFWNPLAEDLMAENYEVQE